MVDGILYMWIRNAANSSSPGPKITAEPGLEHLEIHHQLRCPTFLNFGPNYTGAHDPFVYIYSPTPTAPTPRRPHGPRPRAQNSTPRARRLRVSQNHRQRFRDVEQRYLQRVAVFSHKGKCYRSGISYSAPLKRYLWCQTLPAEDPRFKGGLAIFDAPNPGALDHRLLHRRLGHRPGESSSFPTNGSPRRQNPPPGFLRRGLLLGPQSNIDPSPRPIKMFAAIRRISRWPFNHKFLALLALLLMMLLLRLLWGWSVHRHLESQLRALRVRGEPIEPPQITTRSPTPTTPSPSIARPSSGGRGHRFAAKQQSRISPRAGDPAAYERERARYTRGAEGRRAGSGSERPPRESSDASDS